MDLSLPGFDASTVQACTSPILVVTAIRSAHEARGSAYRAVAGRVAAVHAKPGDAEGWLVLGRELA